jgi:hypothetical protein
VSCSLNLRSSTAQRWIRLRLVSTCKWRAEQAGAVRTIADSAWYRSTRSMERFRATKRSPSCWKARESRWNHSLKWTTRLVWMYWSKMKAILAHCLKTLSSQTKTRTWSCRTSELSARLNLSMNEVKTSNAHTACLIRLTSCTTWLTSFGKSTGSSTHTEHHWN